jgi:outer membrane autotransporter protein
LNVAGGGAIDTDDASVNVTGLLGTLAAADVLATLTFDEAKSISDNSALYEFTAALDGTITPTLVSTESITDTSGNKNTADELLSIGSSAAGNLLLVQDAFAAAGSSTINDVLEAAASDVSGGGAAAGLSVITQTAGINAQRLASLRDGSAATGMAAGNGAQGLKVWGQAFGSVGDQDDRDGISGYDVDTIGFAVGVDTENLGDNTVVGLAFAYADTEVDSDSISNANTEIDSYQLTLYGDYDLDERTYLSGQLGYTWSDADTTRNPGGLSAITANGDYDSSSFNARVEAGRDYQSGGVTLTPNVMANYVYYDADSYTETGAGTANLTVSPDALSVFEVGVGVDAAWKVEHADGSYLKPVVSAGVRHDLIGDEFEANNTFAGGGSAFKVQGFDPAQTTFDVGAGVTYFTNSGWDLTAEYDFEFKSDYQAHSGLVKASYNF